jgi:hypothetical protein
MTVTIGRRELLAALGGAVAAWPITAHAPTRLTVAASGRRAASNGTRCRSIVSVGASACDVAAGPKPASVVEEAAAKAHVDEQTLGQARADLGVVTSRGNAGGVQAVQWSLPG